VWVLFTSVSICISFVNRTAFDADSSLLFIGVLLLLITLIMSSILALAMTVEVWWQRRKA
jgi:hypothetical protein